VTAESAEGWDRARWLATTLGLAPFDLSDEHRALYHAGAAMASNYLVALHRAASMLLEEAGAPPEALLPLMHRTMENGFELTGPIARGDWSTVAAHLDAVHARRPDIEPLYRALADLAEGYDCWERFHYRQAWEKLKGAVKALEMSSLFGGPPGVKPALPAIKANAAFLEKLVLDPAEVKEFLPFDLLAHVGRRLRMTHDTEGAMRALVR